MTVAARCGGRSAFLAPGAASAAVTDYPDNGVNIRSAQSGRSTVVGRGFTGQGVTMLCYRRAVGQLPGIGPVDPQPQPCDRGRGVECGIGIQGRDQPRARVLISQ